MTHGATVIEVRFDISSVQALVPTNFLAAPLDLLRVINRKVLDLGNFPFDSSSVRAAATKAWWVRYGPTWHNEPCGSAVDMVARADVFETIYAIAMIASR